LPSSSAFPEVDSAGRRLDGGLGGKVGCAGGESSEGSPRLGWVGSFRFSLADAGAFAGVPKRRFKKFMLDSDFRLLPDSNHR